MLLVLAVCLLKECVRYQEEFAMQHIFCWHSLYGYWAGVSPDTPELAHLSPRVVMPRPSPGAHA